jgi:GAF domain-containing protein
MAVTDPGAEELAAAFARVASALSSASDLEQLLTRVVELAVDTIDSCEFAGVMTRANGQAVTVVASDPFMETIDRLQVEAGEGPCLDVLNGAPSRYVSDFVGDERWPIFGRRAVEVGARSAMGLTIGTHEVPGALNLYSRKPEAFGATDRAQAAIFATHTALAFATQHEHASNRSVAEQLQQALATRELIGQAQGILMERERVTGRQAFDMLRDASQRLNLKLRDVAQRLVDTGESPPTRR